MKIEKHVVIARPPDVVWAAFADVVAMARCFPGAEVTACDLQAGTADGRVTLKLGPFSATFDGSAVIVRDDRLRCGTVEGRGLDKRGGSRSQLTLRYTVGPAPSLPAGGTEVAIDADLTLAGPIAQFGRTGLIADTADVLIATFVHNLETALAPEAPVESGARPAPREGLGAAARPTASPTSPAPLSIRAILVALARRRLAGLLALLRR